MNADLSGADLVTVAHTVAGVQSKLLVKPEIKRPEDLRGKKLAISTFGSLGDFLNRHIIKKYGMEPGRDVILITIGNTPERIQALASVAWMPRISTIPPTRRRNDSALKYCGMPNRK
jgi:NitT/TauT family transport system substrate-binding protein